MAIRETLQFEDRINASMNVRNLTILRMAGLAATQSSRSVSGLDQLASQVFTESAGRIFLQRCCDVDDSPGQDAG